MGLTAAIFLIETEQRIEQHARVAFGAGFERVRPDSSGICWSVKARGKWFVVRFTGDGIEYELVAAEYQDLWENPPTEREARRLRCEGLVRLRAVRFFPEHEFEEFRYDEFQDRWYVHVRNRGWYLHVPADPEATRDYTFDASLPLARLQDVKDDSMSERMVVLRAAERHFGIINDAGEDQALAAVRAIEVSEEGGRWLVRLRRRHGQSSWFHAVPSGVRGWQFPACDDPTAKTET